MIIFHKKSKHVLVGNGILDKIFVKAVAKNFLCGVSINSILHKDRCAGKAEYLGIVKELHNILMTVTEMAAMTLVKDHDNARVAYFLYTAAIPLSADGGIEFLYGGDNYL